MWKRECQQSASGQSSLHTGGDASRQRLNKTHNYFVDSVSDLSLNLSTDIFHPTIQDSGPMRGACKSNRGSAFLNLSLVGQLQNHDFLVQDSQTLFLACDFQCVCVCAMRTCRWEMLITMAVWHTFSQMMLLRHLIKCTLWTVVNTNQQLHVIRCASWEMTSYHDFTDAIRGGQTFTRRATCFWNPLMRRTHRFLCPSPD